MTERFTIKEIDNFSYGIKVTDIILDNGIELSQSTVCDLLNNLVKENEYLHKYNSKLQKQPLLFDVQTIPDTMEIMEVNTQLEKENEQLKKDIEYYKTERLALFEYLDKKDDLKLELKVEK